MDKSRCPFLGWGIVHPVRTRTTARSPKMEQPQPMPDLVGERAVIVIKTEFIVRKINAFKRFGITGNGRKAMQEIALGTTSLVYPIHYVNVQVTFRVPLRQIG